MPLISVENDTDSAGGGNIQATQHTVFVNNKAVIIIGDSASPDSLCPTQNGTHCNPKSKVGSSSVFVNNKAVHRDKDDRICGDTNVVVGQTTVFVDS